MSDIKTWLRELGLEKYVSAFVEAEITSSNLADLTEEDLKELGLPLGPRRTFSTAIKRLSDNPDTRVAEVQPNQPAYLKQLAPSRLPRPTPNAVT